MITIERKQDTLNLKAHYNYGKRLREIPGAYFNYDEKVWTCPLSSMQYIKENFKGEIYQKNEDIKRPSVLENVKQVKLPTFQNLSPFPYQKIGSQFMIDRLKNNWFVVNADEVGAGKTIQSIICIQDFINRGLTKILIICKRSLKYQWKSEIEKFMDNPPKVLVSPEAKKKRDDTYREAKELSSVILICNYQNFLNDEDEIQSIGLNFVVIDEAHILKNHKGKMHKKIAKLSQTVPSILLTGTPIMSRPEDLYGILDLGASEYIGSYDYFKGRYLVTEFGIYGEQVIGAKNLDELKSIISNIMIRRTSKEFSIDLPEVMPPIKIIGKKDAVQEKMLGYIDTLTSELDERKATYLKSGVITQEVKDKIAELNEQGKVYIAAKQFIADDPRIIGNITSDFFAFNVLKKMLPKTYKMSMKQEQTIDMIQEIVESGEKVIVFCHFRTPAELLRDDLEKAGIEAVLFTGKESDKTREANLGRFKDDVNVLIGTEAMAEGLNLQFCSFMIHYEQGDTYAQRVQRIGRIRRPGAKSSVLRIYDMVTEDSFDEVKLNKLKKDKTLSKALLD